MIAVDPSSPFTGGAILGDRVRMQRHAADEGVFIRSMATRGQLGGLARSTFDATLVLDAMGYDPVLIETVGVGQDEVDIVTLAHTTVVVSVPGLGDEIQAIKAGVLEAGQLFVINKADHAGADLLRRQLELMLHLRENGLPDADCWRPELLATVAVRGEGVTELIEAADRHRAALSESGRFAASSQSAASTSCWVNWAPPHRRASSSRRATIRARPRSSRTCASAASIHIPPWTRCWHASSWYPPRPPEEHTVLKNLGLIPRRADLTRAAFREHYERRHAPLALRQLRTFHRYVRNHVVDAAPADPPFDALSEFWYETRPTSMR